MNEDYSGLWIFLCDNIQNILIHNNDIISLKYLKNNEIELIYYICTERNLPYINRNYFMIEDKKLEITRKFKIKTINFMTEMETLKTKIKVILNPISKE